VAVEKRKNSSDISEFAYILRSEQDFGPFFRIYFDIQGSLSA